jgi:hypothetical protein
MRSVILTFAPVVLAASLQAQGVFSNKTQIVLEKVIQDYPNHFENIKGELISQALRSSRYKSTLGLPGATSATVTLATTTSGTGSDWNCQVLATPDYDSARARFTEIYGQLSNSIITTEGQKTFILTGQYESPTADKKYTMVTFSLLPGIGDMKRLHVELTMNAAETGEGWVIAVNVSDEAPREIAKY